MQIDDDLRGVRPLIGKNRLQKDPYVIREIINNNHQVAADLDMNVFAWSRSGNAPLMQPDLIPFRLVAPVSSSFGVRGAARQRLFDESLPGRADLDFTLRTILEDRILLIDMRWIFDHGRVFSGLGGNVGLVTKEMWDATTRRVHERWGRHVGGKKPGYVKGLKATSVMSIRVKRHNPTVTK